jgi:excisionase family DNA binding protein
VNALDALIDDVAKAVTERVSAKPEWPAVLTAEQCAAMCQVHVDTIRREVAAGTFPGMKIGGGWRFSRDEVLAHLAGRAPVLRAVASA